MSKNSVILVTVVVLLGIAGAAIFYLKNVNQIPKTTATYSDSPFDDTGTNEIPQITPGAHSGRGVIDRAFVEEGGTAQLIEIPSIGMFAILNSTQMYGMNGEKVTFSYFKRGQLVDIVGSPDDGANKTESIRVLGENYPVPTTKVGR